MCQLGRALLLCGLGVLACARLQVALLAPGNPGPADAVLATQLALLGGAATFLATRRRTALSVQARLSSREIDVVRVVRDWAMARDARVRRVRVRRGGLTAIVSGHGGLGATSGAARLRSWALAVCAVLGRAVLLVALPAGGGLVAALARHAGVPDAAVGMHEGLVAVAGLTALVLTASPPGVIRYTVTVRDDLLVATASRDNAEARDALAFLVRLCEARTARPLHAPRSGQACHALTLLPTAAGWPPVPPRRHGPAAEMRYVEDCRAWVARLASGVTADDLIRPPAEGALSLAARRASLSERRLVAVLRGAGLPAEVGVMIPSGRRHPDPLLSHYWPDAAVREPACLLLIDVECDGPSHRTEGRPQRDGRRNGWLAGRGWYVARVTLADTDRGWPAAVAEDLRHLVHIHRTAFRVGSAAYRETHHAPGPWPAKGGCTRQHHRWCMTNSARSLAESGVDEGGNQLKTSLAGHQG